MAEARVPTVRRQQPLSPHIGIYHPAINMVMSIVHRITGSALYVGTLLLAWWLIAIAQGPQALDIVNVVFAHPLGKLILVGYTWALLHHMLGGLRHFVWDTGSGFDLATVDRMSWSTIIGSVILTAGLWAYVLHAQGAF